MSCSGREHNTLMAHNSGMALAHAHRDLKAAENIPAEYISGLRKGADLISPQLLFRCICSFSQVVKI